jgi:hypothetical protein
MGWPGGSEGEVARDKNREENRTLKIAGCGIQLIEAEGDFEIDTDWDGSSVGSFAGD